MPVKHRYYFIVFAALLGIVYFYACRHSMTSDGLSYLDIAFEMKNGNLHYLVNPIWSPLYPFFLGISLILLKPSPFLEFTVVHLVNYLIFILCIFSFELFISQCISIQTNEIKNASIKNEIKIPKNLLYVLSYVIFIQLTINVIDLWGPCPDMLVMAVVLLISRQLLKITLNINQSGSVMDFIVLGILFGIGYLSKAPMFIISLFYLLVLLFIQSTSKKNMTYLLISFLFFVIISAPYILLLSAQTGRLTFGESGKLNYAWYVNDTPFFVHWQGGTSKNKTSMENGSPLHPSRKIYNKPNVYEFSEPIGGTYPPWFNPVYWYEGVKPHFDFSRQIAAIAASLKEHHKLFVKQQLAILFGLILLFLYVIRDKKIFTEARYLYLLILPALFSFVMFSLVHLESRYIAPFVLPFYVSLFMLIKIENSEFNNKLIKVTVLSVIALLSLVTLTTEVREVYNWISKGSIHEDWLIAEDLRKSGIKEEDKIATIGYKIPYSAYWAKVLNVKIVSEIVGNEDRDFWYADSKVKNEIINIFKSTGARAIVAVNAPKNCIREGWVKVGKSRQIVPKGAFLHDFEKGFIDTTYVYLLNSK